MPRCLGQLEVLLAAHYRDQGFQVEHVGTGGTRARFDGGVDLKLRKADEFILVQCKHSNAKQVPHNDVHQLIGIMVNEGATGAILVTSGEFARYAIESASKQGHVQLIDGDQLRAMIGPLPDSHAQHALPSRAARAVNDFRTRHENRPGRGRGRHSVARVVTGVVIALAFVFSIAFVRRHSPGTQAMSKTIRYALLAISIALSMVASATPNRFPALGVLPEKPRQALATLMDWQSSLEDLKVSEIEAKFGKPYKTTDGGINPVSGSAMQTMCYRLSRMSQLRITIHKGEVVAVSTIVMPSANEDGPIDD